LAFFGGRESSKEAFKIMDQRVLFARNRGLPFYGQISKNGILPVIELCILHQRERHFQKSTKNSRRSDESSPVSDTPYLLYHTIFQ